MDQIVLAAVNAKYIHSNLAVYSLKAYAGKAGQPVRIREYTINQPMGEILKDLYKSRPGLLCFSCYIWNKSLIEELAGEIRKLLPDIWIWIGGPEVTYCALEYLEAHPAVDGIMKGEGEETFLELVTCYRQGKDQNQLLQIPGLAVRRGNTVCETQDQKLLDMDSIPFPYGCLEDFSNRIIYYESSRGCPFSCSYCLSSIEKKIRFRSLELVKQEIQFFIDRKVPQVKFVDRTFNCNRKRALEIWKFLAEQDRGITNFHFEIVAELLEDEEIACMHSMRPGLIQLEIGVQSANPRTLQEICRNMNFPKLKICVEKIRQGRNIHQHLDLIAGLPFENYESFSRSFDAVYGMRPQQLQLGFLKILKGSRMETMAGKYGCVYMNREPYEVLKTRWLSYEEILSLKQVESMVEIYYNSGQFLRTLSLLEHLFPSFFAFYEALGDFYERKGYSQISHSRLRRYEILREFVVEWTKALQKEERERLLENLTEAMTVDLYSRENLKSRPAWMKCQEQWQKDIRDYIRREKLPKTVHIEVLSEETLLFDYTRRDPLTNNGTCRQISNLTM